MLTIQAIFILLGRLIAWPFRHRGIFVIIIIAVILLVVVPKFTSNKSSVTIDQSIPIYQQNHPAGTAIATPSKLYYAVDYTDDGKIVTMTKFYDWDGKKWVLRTIPLQLDRAYIGEVLIDKK